MVWLAVDKDGAEYICDNRPYRREIMGEWIPRYDVDYMIRLPFGTIEKLIGHSLTWEDEPVELK